MVEVALAIQFGESIAFRVLDLGRVAAAWADTLPNVSERPRVSRMESTELLGDDFDEILASIFEEDAARNSAPRLWLENTSGDKVVQIQPDRLIVNWRKGQSGSPYPRYRAIREMLVDAWGRLGVVCAELGYDEPCPERCEIQYINRLGPEQGWAMPQDTERLVVPWNGLGDAGVLPSDHRASFFLHCHFPDDREGYLEIEGWAGSCGEGTEMTLDLMSRGWIPSNDFEGALDFLDTAHRWIVRGFTAITTPEAHAAWGRTR